jgi:hypothetical protein
LIQEYYKLSKDETLQSNIFNPKGDMKKDPKSVLKAKDVLTTGGLSISDIKSMVRNEVICIIQG